MSASTTPPTLPSARSPSTASARRRSGVGDGRRDRARACWPARDRILLASGCRVVGIDLDDAAVELARGAGVTALARDDPGSRTLCGRRPAASASTPCFLRLVFLARPARAGCSLARDRGRIVVVGETTIWSTGADVREGARTTDVPLVRAGRYDRDYEERGRDLAPGYVRWTEQRNMQAFLDLVAAGASAGRADDPPIPHRRRTRGVRPSPARARRAPFGVLLEYSELAARRPVGPRSRSGLLTPASAWL